MTGRKLSSIQLANMEHVYQSVYSVGQDGVKGGIVIPARCKFHFNMLICFKIQVTICPFPPSPLIPNIYLTIPLSLLFQKRRKSYLLNHCLGTQTRAHFTKFNIRRYGIRLISEFAFDKSCKLVFLIFFGLFANNYRIYCEVS